MPTALHSQKVTAHAARTLREAHQSAETTAELLPVYKSFLKKEEHRIRLAHKQCALRREGGLEVCAKRAATLDVVLHNLFDSALKKQPASTRLALVATGGYGRGLLNPGSDIDLQFLHAGKVTAEIKTVIESVLYMLYDVGFKVGHSVRSLKETFAEANKNNQTKTSLIDTRFLAGEERLFAEFEKRFRKECIDGHEASFLEARRLDLIKRHNEHFHTFLVKEPHLKNGCGGLRDFNNLLWITWVKVGLKSIDDLVKARLLTAIAGKELKRAHDFLMLVRNDLHYSERNGSDILTLRAQGVIAKDLDYPGRRITRKTDAFMKDYYQHTRNIFQHNQSIMERFELELEAKPKPRLLGVLSFRSKPPARESFDGFYSENGYIFPEKQEVFKDDSGRLMRVFQHAQLRRLGLSPQIRHLFKESYRAINKTFLYKKANRETFEAILARKGDVGFALRQMHRVGFLGRYLPEFGALTDLVQHEFFHRFTADEHTLQTVDKLDELSASENAKTSLQQQLFHDLEDPMVLYLALIMHDTGRGAENNVRQHEWASEALTDKVCRRLQISPKRRRLLMFLVAHHLTLWHTATTKDLDDPEVIAEFARLVKTREALDALYLLTFADSSATYEHGWSDWKESLLRRLYNNTAEYLADQKGFHSRAQHAGAELRATVEKTFDASYDAEIAAHFGQMPERYFHVREANRVIDHLRLMRKFFRQLAKDDREAALTPALKWTAHPEQGCSELTLVSWDRRMLLAKVAGALAATNLNILSADLFLRKDNLVLDIFRVCTTKLEPVTAEKDIASVQALVDRALTGEEIDFLKLIERHTDQRPAPPSDWQLEFPTRVYVSNTLHRDYTTVEIQAVDRVGLLYAVFKAIGALGFEITHARINTERGAAIDSFYIVGDYGLKVTDASKLEELRLRVAEAAGVKSKGTHNISG